MNTTRLSLLIFALVFLGISVLFGMIGVDPHHDGILFKPALDVAHGQVLFRDTFHQYGALTTFIQALSITCFGETVFAIHISAAIFYALSLVFLGLVWRRFLSVFWMNVACGLLILLAPFYVLDFFAWSSVYALFFLAVSLWGAIKAYETSNRLFLFLAGIAAALTFWTRQPTGMVLFVGLSVAIFGYYYWLDRRIKSSGKAVCIFLAGWIGANSVFFIWLARHQAMRDWYCQSIELIRIFKGQFGGSILHIPGALFPILMSPIWAIFPSVILVVLIQTFRQRHTQPLIKTGIMLTCVAVCIASWAQYFPITTCDHAYWAAAPMIGVFIYFLVNLFKNEPRCYRILFVFMLLFSIFLNDVYIRAYAGFEKMSKAGFIQIPATPIVRKYIDHRFWDRQTAFIQIQTPTPLAHLYLSPETADFYLRISRDLNDYLARYPDRGFVNLSEELLFNTFLAKDYRFHPVKMDWPILEMLYPDYAHKRDAYIRTYRPIIIRFGTENVVQGYKVMDELIPPFPTREAGEYFILVPK